MLAYEQAVLDLGPDIYLPMNEANLADPIKNLAVSELGRPDFPQAITRFNITLAADHPLKLPPEVGSNGCWQFNGTSSYARLLNEDYLFDYATTPLPGVHVDNTGTTLTEWTVCIWVKPNTVASDSWRTMYRVSDYGHGFAFFQRASATTVDAMRAYTYNGTGAFYGFDRQTTKFGGRGWRFIWMRFNGTRYSQGVDDAHWVQHTSDISGLRFVYNDYYLSSAIGRNGGYSTEYYSGKMCHFAMFPRALEDAELWSLYDSGTDTRELSQQPEPTRFIEERSRGHRLNVIPIDEDPLRYEPKGDGLTLLSDTAISSQLAGSSSIPTNASVVAMPDNKYVVLGSSGSSLKYLVIGVDTGTWAPSLLTAPTTIAADINPSLTMTFLKLSDTKIGFFYGGQASAYPKERVITWDGGTNTIALGAATSVFSSAWRATTATGLNTHGKVLNVDGTYLVRTLGDLSLSYDRRSPNFLLYKWNSGPETLTAAGYDLHLTTGDSIAYSGTSFQTTFYPRLYRVDGDRFLVVYARAGNQPGSSSLAYEMKFVVAVGTINKVSNQITFDDVILWRAASPEGWGEVSTGLPVHYHQHESLFRQPFTATGGEYEVLLSHEGGTPQVFGPVLPEQSLLHVGQQSSTAMAGDSFFLYGSTNVGGFVVPYVQRVALEPDYKYAHYTKARTVGVAGMTQFSSLNAAELDADHLALIYDSRVPDSSTLETIAGEDFELLDGDILQLAASTYIADLRVAIYEKQKVG